MPERILIVEDEPTLRESLKRVFLRDGYEVETVAQAESALQHFEEGAYDLILTDILLPGMDGIEFLQDVKRQAPDNFINPDELSNLQKKTLKESFNLMTKVQGLIVEQYKTFFR